MDVLNEKLVNVYALKKEIAMLMITGKFMIMIIS